MNLGFIVALVFAIPVILFPAIFIWHVNISGAYQAIREAWKRQAARSKKAKVIPDAGCRG